MNLRSGVILVLPLLALCGAPHSAVAQNITAHEPLGRVLYSPEQRRALEARVRGSAPPQTDVVFSPNSQTGAALHYNGMARREGGAPLVWVNGQAVNPAQAPPVDGDALVVTPAQQRLRPGQRSGVPELAPGARIEVHRRVR